VEEGREGGRRRREEEEGGGVGGGRRSRRMGGWRREEGETEEEPEEEEGEEEGPHIEDRLVPTEAAEGYGKQAGIFRKSGPDGDITGVESPILSWPREHQFDENATRIEK
jgi:hypothetical protein